MPRVFCMMPALALAGVVTVSGARAADDPLSFTSAAYQSAKDKAVVLVSANWARRWRCGAFENAALQSFGFDHAGSKKDGLAEKADLLIEDSSLLPASQSFVNFAYIVEPGEYLFSSYKIKAAKSMTQVGYFSGDRGSLVSDGKSKAGSFTVAPGEIVYIGHFALDCAKAPMPWRYYPEDKQAFAKYLEAVARDFPGLPVEKAKFRLLETTVIGAPFTLPEQ
jgi:hypothetical protein